MKPAKLFFFIKLAACFCVILGATAANAAVPNQWLGQIYVEALGRVPDENGWNSNVAQFSGGVCNATKVKAVAQGVLLSSEFSALGYSKYEKTLILYRALLRREPDSSGYANWVANIGANTWTTIVTGFLNSAEFGASVANICNNKLGVFATGYLPLTIPVAGDGFAPDPAKSDVQNFNDLQFLLLLTSPGSSLALKQRAVIKLTGKLIIPDGVTLKTYGEPNRFHYASMARLIRATSSTTSVTSLVEIEDDAALKSVWVDGQRHRYGHLFNIDRILVGETNVTVVGGRNVVVSNNRISNTAGWSSLSTVQANPSGFRCESVTIANNIVDAFSSKHTMSEGGGWSDGISNACENGLVEYNDVIDATDVGIIVFGVGVSVDPSTGFMTPAQRSIVRYNNVVNVGNSVFAGLATQNYDGDPSSIQYRNFTGTSFENNHIWTSASAHMDAMISVGTKIWFGDNEDIGVGVKFINNYTGNIVSRAAMGIVVANQVFATVTGNGLLVSLFDHPTCPNFNVVADAILWSNIQPYELYPLVSCITSGPH